MQKEVVIRQSMQPKCPKPAYSLESILTILVEDSVESVPVVTSNFPHVTGKRSWKKSVLLCKQGTFFCYWIKISLCWFQDGKAPEGLHCKFLAKYCSALRDLFS